MFWWMLRYVEEEQKQAQKKPERVLFELNVDEMTLANVAKKKCNPENRNVMQSFSSWMQLKALKR
jgi:hypothetical protein